MLLLKVVPRIFGDQKSGISKYLPRFSQHLRLLRFLNSVATFLRTRVTVMGSKFGMDDFRIPASFLDFFLEFGKLALTRLSFSLFLLTSLLLCLALAFLLPFLSP